MIKEHVLLKKGLTQYLRSKIIIISIYLEPIKFNV